MKDALNSLTLQCSTRNCIIIRKYETLHIFH